MADEFKITISLNVLNHLGINLYSNMASVLAETVANAWDADAENVHINIDRGNGLIRIFDDGHGMTRQDINEKYLKVGYPRREYPDGKVTKRYDRPVMGRKGIGKLSLFSIADTIEIYSARDGEKSALSMSLPAIKAQIKDAGEAGRAYRPDVLDTDVIDWSNGTMILLKDLRQKRIYEASLRKKLARRFSIIGDKYKFQVYINGTPISIADRDYFNKMEHIWTYGTIEFPNVLIPNQTKSDACTQNGFPVSGWIGTVTESSDLKDEDGESLNKIVVMVRDKLAQEDILSELNETGLYSKYLIGEIHADFLDTDDLDDIATSSRQHIIEDDARYVELRDWVKVQLKMIQNQWTRLRNEKGKDEALKVPAVKDWFGSLSPEYKSTATKLFGRINQITVERAEDREALFSHAVLAFESLKYRDNLEALEKISVENLAELTEIFGRLDELEATLYYQIVKERIEVIKLLHEKVESNALEKVIQEHLFTHLWLLDPSWERATDSWAMEQRVGKFMEHIDAGLTDEEKRARLDIRYKQVSNKHVIIELKRPERTVDVWELGKQVDKYRSGLQKILAEAGLKEPMEFICVVGKPLKGWNDAITRDEETHILKSKDARVVTYLELINSAMRAYQGFLEQSKTAGRVFDVIRGIQGDAQK